MTVLVTRTPEELAYPRSGAWGLVPTMGALHAGHLTLIARAAAENDDAVVSIFVNPAQFSNAADLSQYPRDIDIDIDKAVSAGATIIYAPEVETIYPPGFATWIEPGPLSHRWEGASRPGHFRGVATVVAILMNSIRADRVYFGEKDYQQVQVVKRMHRDLRLPGVVLSGPTVRDTDGLALSSRNSRLSPAGRQLARQIPLGLAAIGQAAQQGVHDSGQLLKLGERALQQPGIEVDYLAIVDGDTLEPVATVAGHCRVLVAVVVDQVRLIDNIALSTVAPSASE